MKKTYKFIELFVLLSDSTLYNTMKPMRCQLKCLLQLSHQNRYNLGVVYMYVQCTKTFLTPLNILSCEKQWSGVWVLPNIAAVHLFLLIVFKWRTERPHKKIVKPSSGSIVLAIYGIVISMPSAIWICTCAAILVKLCSIPLNQMELYI